MRKLALAVALGAVTALPAVAGEEIFPLDEIALRWQPAAAQSPWQDMPLAESPSSVEALPAPNRPTFNGANRVGEGWAELDGWMGGDPTLRHWVMHRFDLDADGWLTADEAAMARRAFYSIADANRSDVISREEFVAGWSTVRRELRSFYAIGIDRA